MYRIELSPGEVTVFRTIEELATGVRNGLISPKARIFHNASGKWLPIEFHPHYKAALALLAGRPTDTAIPTPKPAEPPSFEKLSFLKPPGEKPSNDHPTSEKPPSDKQSGATPGSDTPSSEKRPHDRPWNDGRSNDRPPVARPTGEHPTATPAREAREGAHVVARQPEDAHPGLPRDAARVLARDPGLENAAPPVPSAPRSGRSPASRSPFGLPSPVELEGEPELPRAPMAARPAPRLRDPFFEPDASAEPDIDGSAHSVAVQPRTAPASVPGVTSSPVLELPKISYAQFTPAEPPVAEGPSRARPRRRIGYIIGLLVVLAAGGYTASLVVSPAWREHQTDARSAMTGPLPAPEPDAHPVASRGIENLRRSTSSPARAPAAPPGTPVASRPAVPPASSSAPLPPASSGFAPALDPRAIVTTPLKTARPDVPDSLPGAAPSIDMDLATPALQTQDSVAGPPPRQGDSTMKKILRALNGGKDTPPQP